mmetsp:Transcript_952/g.1179  ORF Transcript_952/g.1179 Transcript_952/m.1179 type:complete len:655 (-) Transcript_952:444-2408(-)|eukprot:CAMPEP_0194153684 /NCGR_PEP_ID=MMETSP0152-20130528/57340_1 /TAXON_ID=1049557 /ORGANISM="Thalassiothrix antarctica, Strain L6-D1" /LENGTH=654 /DNA_ID=CAMNT_0038859137 /DNA_START=50 /DNA_END=2014 /DNA_ORIENTATION=-
MTTQPQPETQNRLFGFGSNYFHALGGSNEVFLSKEIEAHEFQYEDNKADDKDYLTEFLKIKQLACTTTSSILLNEDGKIYQMGTIHGKQFTRPTRISMSVRAVEIAGGRHFCLARSASGSVYSWGAGHFGQLGQGPHISFLENPQLITHLQPHVIKSPIVQLACGHWHGAALTEDGRIFCWGSNRKHQCGTKTPSTIVTPHYVNGTDVVYSQIECGKGHNIALEKFTGRVYTWGASTACGHTSRRTCISPPRLVEALQRVVIVQIAAGDGHSLAMTGGGRVFSWGSGSEGQLGVGGTFPVIPRPKLVGDLDFVAIVAAQQSQRSKQNEPLGTSNFSVAPNPNKDSNTNIQPNATAVSQILANTPKVTEIYAAGSYSLAISSTGHVYGWGYNDTKVLGLPRPCTDLLPYLEPANSSTATISQLKNRVSQARAFDSSHNVLLPRRIDALHTLDVKLVAGGPSHLLFYGHARDDTTVNSLVGRTLHEVQQARRAGQNQATEQDDDLSMESIETDAVTSATEAMSPNTDQFLVSGSNNEVIITELNNTKRESANNSDSEDEKKVSKEDDKTLIKERTQIDARTESGKTMLENDVSKPSSIPHRARSLASQESSSSRLGRKPSMSMPKIMRKLTSSKRNNGKEPPKRRQFFGPFGGSKG